MTMPSTPEGTGLTDAQASERLLARYQSQDQGNEGEAEAHEAETEDEADPEALEAEGEADPDVDPDADPEEDDGEPDAPQTFKVKVQGEEIEVPLDELIKGYSREQDYTRKTQAHAEKVKAEQAAIADARTRYEAQLQTVAQIIEANQPKVDRSLRERDPAEWSAQMLQARQWDEQRKALAVEQERVRAEAEAEQSEQYAAYVRDQQAKLPELIPEWRDPKVAEAEVGKIHAYGVTQGFDASEIDDISDARAVAVLRKAMLYDDLLSKRTDVRSQVDRVKTLPPGPRSTPSSQAREKAARARLAEDGSTDAAVQLLLSRQRRP